MSDDERSKLHDLSPREQRLRGYLARDLGEIEQSEGEEQLEADAEARVAELEAEVERLTRERDKAIARATICPVCGEHDPDGLEACAECYTVHFQRGIRAEAAEAHVTELEAEVERLRERHTDAPSGPKEKVV